MTTQDGYILTVFRCNSKIEFPGPKKAVILQHGILSSSDDFCVNIPEQALRKLEMNQTNKKRSNWIYFSTCVEIYKKSNLH